MRVPGVPYVQGRNTYTDRDGRKYGIAIHNTANTATAEGEAAYATRRTDGISSHFYVDSDSIVQSLDTDSRAGHAGSSEGNENAIAFEITGLNSWTRQQWLDRVAWDKLGAALAVLCKTYGISVRRASVDEMRSNPKVRAFYGHDDMRRAWGGTTHTDPGPNFPWDRLFQAVNAGGDDMQDDERKALFQILAATRYGDGRLEAIASGREKVADNPAFLGVGEPMWLVQQVKTLIAAVAQLAGKDFTDEPAIVAGVLAGLSPQAIAAAIPPELAKQVADELVARLQS